MGRAVLVAVAVAVAAAIGSFLQGRDNATIAGSILYIKKEFNLETQPTMEGLIVALSLIGAVLITTCSGAIADWLGRRPLLITSSVLYFVSGLVILWSPNIYILLLARLLDGFGVGLAVSLFTGCIGMFFSYCMVFGMSLMSSPAWRLTLDVSSIPSVLYFILTISYLPESPRWLVSKGRMLDLKRVLQRLCGQEDVSGETALLVEGLGVGGKTSMEEYIIGPANEFVEDREPSAQKDQIRLYGPEQGRSLVARPVTRQSVLGIALRQGSTFAHNVSLMDPLPDAGSKGSMLFPHLGSMFSVAGNQTKNEEWDEENLAIEGDDYASDAPAEESDDNLQSPLISRQTTSLEKDMVPPPSHGSIFSIMQGNDGEPVGSAGIGGGWQLAWKWTEREGDDGKEGGFKRIYLHEGGTQGIRRGSLVSLTGGDMPGGGQFVRTAALVSQPALYSEDAVGPAMIHPSEATGKGPSWSDLFEPRVKHALIVGVGIQILQQFSGINGVMYYTPQILEQAGVGVLLSNIGISSASASLLISAITNFLMLPSITVAMRLMDISGRRSLLLGTIPILIIALIALVIGNLVTMGTVAKAAISTVCVILY
ncbi:hypothetical protein K7X08_037173 [Anisodus acutangulus]|uniref:Uncharacterized protein n=1 Tax=Anisodus acutangulus TaxID=402998 RepID=A0A9Q1QXK7_9SOLA|nr:hypothetical protein K7X08_037173 [Anisodus acutangulus]